MEVLKTSWPACWRAVTAAALVAALGAGAFGGSGNYLIIAAEDYVGSDPLTEFADAKAAMGFTVSVYSVPAGTGRQAIKDYISTLWGTPDAPDYILLVGDTDGSSSTSNTIPHWVGAGSQHATTDLPYACMDPGDDWYPDIYIGRFSVRSVSVLQDVVDKSLCVEGGNFPDPEYVKRAAFLASDDTTTQSEDLHDSIIERYMEPAGFDCTKIYAGQGGNTADITAAVNAGTLFVVYFGHSSSSGWWSPGFNQSNVNALTNDGLYGLAMGWSCNTANFSLDECFGETWQRKANAGAVAYLSASDYVWWGSVEAWESSRRMEKYFFKAIFQAGIWEVGPAWQAACYDLLADPDFGPTHDHTRNIFEEFVLLGDPALHLPEGEGFTLTATPASQELCSPPDDQAVYTIEVGQMGSFFEAVTLSASGEPAGTTVSFSVNPGVPPFTSVMTVGSIDAGSIGDYNIQITGTSPSMQRWTVVQLRIASGAPAGVTLISPPDGATGVALTPTLTWEASPGGWDYDVEVATDQGFGNVVYGATVSEPSHTVGTPLDTLTGYYWHVRAVNACGQSEFSPAFSFTTLNMILPASYDLLNGETGTYSYFDDNYDGDGDNTVPLEPLSNGLGDLTDGVIATQHWNQTYQPYVGWVTIDPTITFHFTTPQTINTVTLHLDDSGGGGGVHVPTDVTITVGDTTLVFPVEDPPGSEPFAISFTDLGLVGDTLELTLADYSTSGYMMLSEVEFCGGPILGDVNCDGAVNAFDIDPFVLALTDEGAYYAAYPNCDHMLADINGDGTVNAFDIDPFVELLTGG